MSCFPDPKQLLPVALETVLISFRAGLFAAHIRDQISAGKANLSSWSVKIETEVEKPNLQQQLQEFSSQKVSIEEYKILH